MAKPEVLAVNEPHLACVLLLDTSSSMSGEAIDSLNRGLRDFKTQVSQDDIAQRRVDIAIVEFNDQVRIVQNFCPIPNMEPVTLHANGCTAMGAAILQAIDLVNERRRLYATLGTPCFKPWIFMITDGAPTDSIEEAIDKVQSEEAKGKYGHLKFFALGVKDYDKNTLFRITKRVMELRDVDFSSIFDWFGASMCCISASSPGEEPPLPCLPQNARKADPDRDVQDW